MCGAGGFLLACEDLGESFFSPVPRLRFFFFFQVEIRPRALIPFVMPKSVHSGSATWDDCDRTFADKLRVSSNVLQHQKDIKGSGVWGLRGVTKEGLERRSRSELSGQTACDTTLITRCGTEQLKLWTNLSGFWWWAALFGTRWRGGLYRRPSKSLNPGTVPWPKR